jgi:hypothetical protein
MSSDFLKNRRDPKRWHGIFLSRIQLKMVLRLTEKSCFTSGSWMKGSSLSLTGAAGCSDFSSSRTIMRSFSKISLSVIRYIGLSITWDLCLYASTGQNLGMSMELAVPEGPGPSYKDPFIYELAVVDRYSLSARWFFPPALGRLI